MKKLSFLAVLMLAAAAFTAGSAAAQSATANATATIVNGLTLAKTADLRFGNVIPSGSTGTVIVSTASARTNTGGATPTSGLAYGAASFDVNGTGSLTYAITLPTSISISDGASHSMTVDTFTSSPNAVGVLNAGYQELKVGGTLHVGALQELGSYTGTFDVSVAYN